MRTACTPLAALALLLYANTARAQDTAAVADTIAFTTAAVTVRTRPLASASVVVQLPAGAQVRLYSCTSGWCRIAVQRLSGYALQEYLSRQPPQATGAQGRGYINAQGQWVPSPMRTPDNRPPAGATARCRDGTFSFSQTRRGTCSHHGGVAEWLRP